MAEKINASINELYEKAEKLNLSIQHDCGGYRVTSIYDGGYRYIFPSDGICPTASKRECMIFMLGIEHQRKDKICYELKV